jgi:hypothetical protein
VPAEFRCPTCRARFTPPRSAGTRTECPQCGELLEIDRPAEEPEEKPPPKKPSRASRDDYDEPEPDRRPRRPRRPAPSGGAGKLLLTLGGGVILLAVVGGVGWAVWRFAGQLGGGGEFKEFSPAGGNFTVLMPSASERKGLEILIQSLTAWEGSRGGVTYVVGYADDGGGWMVDRPTLESLYSQVSGRGQFGVEGSDEFGYYASGSWNERELRASDNSDYLSGRTWLAGGRFYVLFAYGKDARRSNPEVRRFLDSFKLTNGPPPPWENNPRYRAVDEAYARRRASNGDAPPPVAQPMAPASPPTATPLDQPTPKRPRTSPKTNPPAPSNPPPASPPVVPPAATLPRPGTTPQPPRDPMLGSPSDPPFRDAAPAGGLLVGFDVGLAKFTSYPVVGCVRPIYRVGDKDSTGQVYGKRSDAGTGRVLARPGYAVGALTARTGLFIDGFSVTFMRVKADGKLDPKDAYESEWVGNRMGGSGPTKLGGDGTPAVGVVGRAGAEQVSAIGLVFQGREGAGNGR